MKYYALKSMERFIFSCISKTEEEFRAKVEKAYWSERRMQPKDTKFTMDDFLSDVDIVTIEINKVDIKL